MLCRFGTQVTFGFALFLLSVLDLNGAYADIYVYKDEIGQVVFTNVPCTEGQQLRYGCRKVLEMPSRQWHWVTDVNEDGKVTISDVPGWFNWVFYYPGDWIIYRLLAGKSSRLAEFLEVSPDSYGGKVSFALSLLVWVFFITLVGALIESSRY